MVRKVYGNLLIPVHLLNTALMDDWLPGNNIGPIQDPGICECTCTCVAVTLLCTHNSILDMHTSNTLFWKEYNCVEKVLHFGDNNRW